jgi:hypothetical protein
VKTIRLWPVLLALAAGILIGYLVFHGGGPDPAYWVSKADYDQAVADMSDGLENVFAIVAARDATIKLQNEFVALGQRKIIELEATADTQTQVIAARDANLDRLRSDAQAAIAANPQVKALVDAYEAGRVEDKALIFTLKSGWEAEKAVSQAKDIKILALTDQRDTWKKTYEDEHALRLACESLNKSLESQYHKTKVATKVVIGAAAAAIIYGIAK